MTNLDKIRTMDKVSKICSTYLDCYDYPLHGTKCGSPDGDVEEKIDMIMKEKMQGGKKNEG